MQITAAVLHKPGAPLTIETLDLADPRPDEMVVRVVSSGICHTDVAAMSLQGRTAAVVRTPMVFGHEGAGVVEAIGSGVTTLAVGDHVVLSFDSCGKCDRCQIGKPGYCREFVVRNFGGARPDGSSALSNSQGRVQGHYFCQSSFASHAIAREASAVKVPSGVPLELLGPLGCGVQTGAGAVINTFQARPGSSIAVFGAGSVGLSAILAAAVCGCSTIVAVDVVATRLDVARTLGATHVFDSRSLDLVREIVATTGHGVDFAFDTTGIPEILEAAMRSLDQLGVLGLVAGSKSGRLDLTSDAIARGRSVRTIIEGDAVPKQFIPTLIDLWQSGRFPFDKLVRFYPFEEINQAIHASESGTVIKPILRFAGA